MSTSPPAAPSVSCSICRDSFTEASDTSALACGHLFHIRCVGEWLKQSQTCPQCRRQLRNPQKEATRIFLSFGRGGEDLPEEGEPPGLAELRQQLAAATEEKEKAQKRMKSWARRDAKMRRDLSERQRQIETFSMQLETYRDSITQQETENNQLMQLLAQEYHEESELKQLRSQLDQERLARERLVDRLREREDQSESHIAAQRGEIKDLRDRLAASQQELELLTDALQSERAAVSDATEELLAREAESFQLSKRLTAGHVHNSLLADQLSRSQQRVAQLSDQLLRLRTLRATGTGSFDLQELQMQFASLPIIQRPSSRPPVGQETECEPDACQQASYQSLVS